MSKLVVITGASQGLGLVLAEEFANGGWKVIGTGRSQQPAALPTGASYRQFDAGDPDATSDFWAQVHKDYPDAQVCLINNAGGYVSGSLLDTEPQDYEQQMRSSYFAAVYTTRGLASQFSHGRIINIISTSALAAHKNNSAYGAAKAAEMHFFQSLQQEFKPEQYQITNLYPSDIASRGPNPEAMTAVDLSGFVRELAESSKTFYLRDATIYARKESENKDQHKTA